MGRVPPFMKPNKVRSIFENHGEVTRIFLQEEGEFVASSMCLQMLLFH
jgi:hypothetical protein